MWGGISYVAQMQIKDDNKYMKPYDKDKASNCVLC